VRAGKGSRPHLEQDKRFISAYLFRAICPARGVGAGLVLPTVSVAAMNSHLAEISVNVSAGAVVILLLDSASWHISKKTCGAGKHHSPAAAALCPGAERG
jgi:hypothetical protein